MYLTKARGIRWASTLGLLALFSVSSAAWADIPASPPPSWIYDEAHLLKPEELTQLTTLREQLERQTGARLAVVTLIDGTEELPKSAAVRTLNQWNAGRKSALLLVVLNPRMLYIQPGTDLARVLNSGTSSSICSDVVAPKLRSGDRAGAIRAGLEAIAARISSGSTSSPPVVQSPASEYYPEPVLNRVSDFIANHIEMIGLGGVGAGILALWWMSARKCRECGTRMKKTTHITLEPTYSSSGQGMHTFTCGACGYSFNERYIISQLVESSSSSSDSSWSSSSSDSSWSSSSSDSSSSSSSSSSSDGSGGGGSSW
ncbi:MAG: TPM domain-containing protein [Hyalangium sp.]|uniref:TPM domain-containing protein n=1 Tax=Hyalangium sp. TaxID=2028555 RepID=UPI00389A7649